MYTAVTSVANDVSAIGIGNITAGSLVTLIVLMVLSGRLTTGKERDYWRDMALELLEQNRQLLKGADTTLHVVRSLHGEEEATK